jgi:hypothetical protein
MKCRCPHCRLAFELEHVLADNDIIATIKMIPMFGKHSNLVWAYLEQFGITPLVLKRKKLRVLLEEMRALFESESFTFQKKKYRISKAGIAEALNTMVHKSFTDNLQNHNYLKKLMIGIAEKEDIEKSKQNEKSLRQKEEGLKSGIRTEEKGITEEQAEINRSKIKDLISSIG